MGIPGISQYPHSHLPNMAENCTTSAHPTPPQQAPLIGNNQTFRLKIMKFYSCWQLLGENLPWNLWQQDTTKFKLHRP